jgi:hypothetical protein
VELSLEEKKTMSNNPNKAPRIEAKQSIHGLLMNPKKPRTPDKKMTKATPSPEAEVIPNTEGSAKGFRNNSCNKSPLMGRAIPVKIAAMAFGIRKSQISFLAESFEFQSKSETSAFPTLRLRKNIPIIKTNKTIMVTEYFKLNSFRKYRNYELNLRFNKQSTPNSSTERLLLDFNNLFTSFSKTFKVFPSV